MKKIILDFDIPENKKELHEYIADKLEFPEYYGKNLDALYDCLTDIAQPTAIGIFEPAPDLRDVDMDLMLYIEKVKDTFNDAEKANPDIAVIYGDLVENEHYGSTEEESEEENFDPSDESFIQEILRKDDRYGFH